MKFITLNVGNMLIFHGYDADNREIVEPVTGQTPTPKLVAIDRIQSVTEKYVLVNGPQGRQLYWEYSDGFEQVKRKLAQAGLLIE
ncbi:hypothetical protein ABWL39_04360 [Chitinivorax sp. PXF-14]|uniref:hypothetical protein n=1 Tax=Chitinivorax sp. PXF-14 TaxID=3230488 RepID=UPI0034663498